MNEKDKQHLRALVRTMYDYQEMRIITSNRLRLKKDGTLMDEEFMDDAEFSESDYTTIKYVFDNSKEVEKKLLKDITEIVEKHPLYSNFLINVRGCGILISAVIFCEFDIFKADTVSKMWQYAGLNPTMVKGKKIIKITKKTDHSQLIKEYENKKGEKCGIVLTNDLIRGDKLTSGYISPFNTWLRTKLCGVLATNMIRNQKGDGKSYAIDFYYPYKQRLENEERWKETTPAHRNNAAKRYMIKMFIQDLYKNWREIEGLPTRVPYQEEYLNHKHE